mgnify:FL=1|jgi:hypothetical protein
MGYLSQMEVCHESNDGWFHDGRYGPNWSFTCSCPSAFDCRFVQVLVFLKKVTPIYLVILSS